ncbi:hypothetical protein DTL70_07800 [Streptomyces diacarni]|uniref:VTT domain-containing protein n=1 Tax=Streptomyces diacarni TaxID=2800381 RepID=A0A367F6J4_9ACTN|nr:hypothetical protein DTL70_07800 [Streptomyces diacarni]
MKDARSGRAHGRRAGEGCGRRTVGDGGAARAHHAAAPRSQRRADRHGGLARRRGQAVSLPLVLLTVAGSALAGDAIVHGAGRRAGRRLDALLSARPRRRAAFDWTAERVWRHGVPFVLVVRFLPSGRLLGGLAAGAAGYPARRFLLGAGLAELLWAGYAVGIGYWGGRAFAGTLPGALVGVGASGALAGCAALVRWGLRRRARGAARVVPPHGGGSFCGSAGAPSGGPAVGSAGEPSGGPFDWSASAASAVTRPAGDPVADGVGEPVGLTSLHEVGRR